MQISTNLIRAFRIKLVHPVQSTAGLYFVRAKRGKVPGENVQSVSVSSQKNLHLRHKSNLANLYSLLRFNAVGNNISLTCHVMSIHILQQKLILTS